MKHDPHSGRTGGYVSVPLGVWGQLCCPLCPGDEDGWLHPRGVAQDWTDADENRMRICIRFRCEQDHYVKMYVWNYKGQAMIQWSYDKE